jgi:predicted amidohydrolase
MRARAIETGCFVLAPAQCGEHAGGRKTYGHSVIVAPWGEVVAEAGDRAGRRSSPTSTSPRSPRRAAKCPRSATTGSSPA